MATPASVSFHTLGCKLNFSETSAIRQQFEDKGFVVRPFEEGADISVINTCSVTDFADRKCRKSVRTALRFNPSSKVIVVGCYAQLKPKEISEIEGVDLVLGAGQKFKILDYLEKLEAAPDKGWLAAEDISEINEYTSAFSFGDRTRSFLKVQDGCDYNCSFCTIPRARGKSRSNTIDNVLSEVSTLASRGAKEIVLTGVNIGDFGLVDGTRQHKFADLLRALEEEKQITRFRISSIEPNLCTPDIIDFVAQSDRIVPHFHMPLQSGNNKQLRLMRRRYQRELYAERVDLIKKRMPHACIGVDVIVGFPGESDEDFEVTNEFLKSLDINYLHVFTYSERADTDALNIKPIVPMAIRKERNQQLRTLSNHLRRKFAGSFLGQSRQVLLEKSKKKGRWTGFTDNYLKVDLPQNNSHQLNDVVWADIKAVNNDGSVAAAIKN